MVKSANDVAVAVAKPWAAPNDQFVAMMNAQRSNWACGPAISSIRMVFPVRGIHHSA